MIPRKGFTVYVHLFPLRYRAERLYYCTLGNVSYNVFASSFVLLTQSKYAVNRPLVSLSPEVVSSVSVGTLRSHPLVDPRVNA